MAIYRRARMETSLQNFPDLASGRELHDLPGVRRRSEPPHREDVSLSFYPIGYDVADRFNLSRTQIRWCFFTECIAVCVWRASLGDVSACPKYPSRPHPADPEQNMKYWRYVLLCFEYMQMISRLLFIATSANRKASELIPPRWALRPSPTPQPQSMDLINGSQLMI